MVRVRTEKCSPYVFGASNGNSIAEHQALDKRIRHSELLNLQDRTKSNSTRIVNYRGKY